MPLSLEHTPVFFPIIVSLMALRPSREGSNYKEPSPPKMAGMAVYESKGKIIVPAGCEKRLVR